jgi:hypothetical protein
MGTVIVVVTPLGSPQTLKGLAAGQLPTWAPELLMNVPEAAPTVTLTAVYVPVATDALATSTSESDCNRVNSKLAAVPEENTETLLPDEEVNEMPTMGKVKLTTVVFVGGVSEMETLSKALPPGLQFVVHRLCTPLQEESDRLAANTAKTRYFLELMRTPHDGFHRHHWRQRADGIPHQHFNPVPGSGCRENPELPKY